MENPFKTELDYLYGRINQLNNFIRILENRRNREYTTVYEIAFVNGRINAFEGAVLEFHERIKYLDKEFERLVQKEKLENSKVGALN